jgi:hypothetical protein
MAREIHVEIALGGEITAEVKGVRGPSCQADLDWLEKLGTVISEGKTADYDRRPDLDQRMDQRANQ